MITGEGLGYDIGSMLFPVTMAIVGVGIALVLLRRKNKKTVPA